MTQLRSAPVLLFLVVCLLLAAGCAGQFSHEKPMDEPSPTDTTNPEITVPGTLDATKFQKIGGVIHTVAKGDRFNITGFAGISNTTAVALWMFGNDYFAFSWIPINQDGSYGYEIRDATTRNLESGPYYIVIQHQGDNNRFDIVSETAGSPESYDQWVVYFPQPSATNTSRIFKINGNDSLTGYHAATSLVQTLKDYRIHEYSTAIQLFIEDPWIATDPVGQRHSGDLFNITGTTNLAEGDELLVEIYPSWYKGWCCMHGKPCPPQDQMGIDIVKVTQGSGGINRWEFRMDGSGTFHFDCRNLPPEEYRVIAEAVVQDASNKSLFRIYS